MIIICSQKNKIHVGANSLDDQGLIARQKAEAGEAARANANPVRENLASQPSPQTQKQAVKPESNSTDVLSIVLAVVGFIISCCGGIIGIVIFFCVVAPLIRNAKNNKSKKVVVKDAKITQKAPGKEKFLLCLKPLIGAVIAVVVWGITPTADEYYYFAALACMAGVLLSFFDIIKLHNELSTRKPPQFGKRGGDEA